MPMNEQDISPSTSPTSASSVDHGSNDQVPRRTTRIRGPPSYFQDYICINVTSTADLAFCAHTITNYCVNP